MELIVIDENKLKIMLTAPDMRHYALCAERMDCADEETRRAFRHIFDDARARIGFDTEGERLFVQLYTSREGGCEIFVTKLGATRPGEYEPEGAWPSLTEEELAALEAALGEAVCSEVYITDTLEELLALCRRLSPVYQGKSAAYIEEMPSSVRWYLILHDPARRELLCEYAHPIPYDDTMEMYIAEHGRVVCSENAVRVLGAL